MESTVAQCVVSDETADGFWPSHEGQKKAVNCFHCGTPCRAELFQREEKSFCCNGCLTVFEILNDNGLTDFYRLSQTAGVRVKGATKAAQFGFLDEPSIRERLADFSDDRITRLRLRIPSIHCIACVWLLENLFRLNPAIASSQVNFPRKELSLTFEHGKTRLSDVAALLASLGYEPELNFSDLEAAGKRPVSRRLWLQLGIAGFAFGNIMLFSISGYLGLDPFTGPGLKRLIALLSLVLATPVVAYSALDYWRAAVVSLRQKLLRIDVPIAAGIAAIYAQSLFEVATGRGEGYFDSLCGLIFFLLCGRLFQQKTFDRLSFERDYKSFFPLSATRKIGRREENVSLSALAIGDRLIVRNGELIPADARLLCGPALIDYSFVTGESEPIEKIPGDYIYAGGRQMGGGIELEIVKAVSQSYLTSLWNQDSFRKRASESLDTITNRYSERFTKIVISIALLAGIYWGIVDSGKALKAFTSVLIVACPCALALAAPFTLGTAVRALGRRKVFLKSSQVVETLARLDAITFDKTGTLTASGAGSGSVQFEGAPLSAAEERWLYSLTRHSTHPAAVRIGEAIAREQFPEEVRSFLETTGCGMEATVSGHEIWIGAGTWLQGRHIHVPALEHLNGSVVYVAIDGRYRGAFVLSHALRPETRELVENLSSKYQLSLLSGDNETDRPRFSKIFGPNTGLYFNQSPLDKLNFIRKLQTSGKTVMMVGDGLNDAGALKQSDLGVAVVENISGFSPASDIIMSAAALGKMDGILRFSKGAVRIVRLSFFISTLYNVVGITIAARALLSPIICAILMPLSSASVVAFACGATTWLARREFKGGSA